MICGSCHIIDNDHRIAVSNGWVLPGQQYAQMEHSAHNTASPHYGYLTCVTCHNQHQSTVYDQGGLKDTPGCYSCHPGYDIEGKAYLDCKSCHMPYAVCATTVNNPNKADVRSHNLKICVTTSPRDSMFYMEDDQTFVKLDSDDHAVGNTLDLVCLSCHQNWDIEDVYEYARNIHTEGLVLPPDPPVEVYGYELSQNYPNPFNQATSIQFSLNTESEVLIEVFDIRGRLVTTLFDGIKSVGQHRETFSSEGLTSGLYFYRLETELFTSTRKMVLLK